MLASMKGRGIALYAVALAIAVAAITCFAPSAAYADEGTWTYDPTAETLTNSDESVILCNVTADQENNLTIGSKQSLEGDLDLTGDVTSFNGNTSYTITVIGDLAFDDCSSLESVTIPDGVRSIGSYAFASCSSLKSVEIPGTVTSIGELAFDGCAALESVTIPDGVTSIEKGVFIGCAALKSVKIPDTVTSIGGFAFGGCIALESVTIPGSVAGIGIYAFDDCAALKSVTILNGVADIGIYTFRNCAALESVTIPGSVTSIGEGVFDGCAALKRVAFLAMNPPTIDSSVFSDCPDGLAIIVPADSLNAYKEANNWSSLASNLETGYFLTVKKGSGSGLYTEGETVDLAADPAPGADQHARWELLGEGDLAVTVCGPTATLTMPDRDATAICTVEPHAFGDWTDNGDGSHARTCACGAIETAAHTFSGRYCTVCGAENPNYVPPAPNYKAEVSASDGGTASASPSWARAGREVSVTCSPDEGFEVRSVAVAGRDGEPVEVVDCGDGTWTFHMPAGGATVEVSFGCDGGALCPSAGFADVDQSLWYHDAVDAAVSSGIMTGYADGSGLFGPDDALTRAQAATVLWRAIGEQAEAPACGMPDVDSGAWYAPAVDWAASAGLMTGYADGSGLFGPDDALTREQLATVLWRAAGAPSAGAFDASAFSDGADASEWAEPALAWAVSTGVLEGSADEAGGTELRPADAVTRAEMATMVERWLAFG